MFRIIHQTFLRGPNATFGQSATKLPIRTICVAPKLRYATQDDWDDNGISEKTIVVFSCGCRTEEDCKCVLENLKKQHSIFETSGPCFCNTGCCPCIIRNVKKQSDRDEGIYSDIE